MAAPAAVAGSARKAVGKSAFFTRLDWAAFWTATLATFAVYFFTLGPSVGLEDSGELATAAAHLGVPHPPGYPFWTLCSWIFCKLFFWVTYMGHPTPAWAVSCCSAVFGAFAAGFTAMLICRSSVDFVGNRTNRALCFAGAVGGALTFALSPVEWSQSTIVEVYSLNAFFLMWVFLLSYRWMRKPSDQILWMTAFIFGLGLTNYQVLAFAVVPLAIIILMRNPAMFRDVFIYLIPVAMTCQVLQIGALDRASRLMSADVINKHAAIAATTSCPSTFFTAVGILAVLSAIVAALVLKNRGEGDKSRTAIVYGGGAGVALILLAGLVFTSKNSWDGVTAPVAPLVEPVHYSIVAAAVAASAVAAVYWVLADDRRGMWAAVGAAVLAVIAAMTVPVAGRAGYLGEPYPWWKSILVFWALVALLVALCWKTPRGMAFAIPVVGMQAAVFILLKAGAMNGLTHPQSWWFWWPVAWNFVLLALVWVALPNGRSVAGAALFAQLGVSFYIYMPIVSDLRNPPMNWGYPRKWEGFKHAIMRGQYEAIGIPKFGSALELFKFIGVQMKHYCGDVMLQFTDIFVPLVAVPFAAGHWLVNRTRRRAFWQWMGAAASCFLMMSLLLILLAQVKGDVQDGFIQKVKFISSHAMIALWIGYGVVFAGVAADKYLLPKLMPRFSWLTRRRFAAAFAALAVLLAFLCPIVQNYTDKRMVFELGGSEQNGHTFGWQFGAYQLDGYKAIIEQLGEDEEPLPDPGYPPPMEEHAIFFGGTDPGRFVPTYMIYAADFRPDVYLITQNALADDTYMSVERDLYGDEIWIPAKEDSGEAFNIYVDEVQRGVRQANGDLQIQNGKVQVTGALGVMEINGILTRMMFDHDRDRHAFYVEESYAIPWMYPYLSPHGLIMKLNRDETPYDRRRAEQDQDFWDWYVRRLLADPMYRRDFAGQKSFSKLRAAIAGLYAKQNRNAEAAQAFREACLLYPASPEASFRYAQECLMPVRKWDAVLELMDYTDSIDPNNKRTANLRRYVEQIKLVSGKIEALNAKRRQDPEGFGDTERFELAYCYYQLGRTMEAAQMVRTLVDRIGDPAALQLISRMLLEAGLDGDAERCLSKYLRMAPGKDWQLWCELAKLQHKTARTGEARNSFRMAYGINSAEVTRRMRRDEKLLDIGLPVLQEMDRNNYKQRRY